MTTTDHHRKAVIRLLRRRALARPGRRRGRPIRRGLGVVGALRSTREAAGYLWSARLHSRLARWVPWAQRPLALSADTERLLRTMRARQMVQASLPHR